MKNVIIYLFASFFFLSIHTIIAQKTALVPFQDEKTGLYGYKDDKTQKVKIKPQFKGAYLFNCGLAPVFNNDENNHWGCIDTKGKVVIPMEFDYIQRFDDDATAVAKKGNDYGIIDKTGKTVIPFEYAALRGFQGSVSCGKNKQNKWGAIDTKNQIVFPFEFEDLSYYPKNGFAIAQKGDLRAILSPDGKNLTPYEFQWSSYVFNEKAVAVGKKGKSGIVDGNGKWILPLDNWELGYEEINLVQIKQNDKMGFVNAMGKIVIPIIYEDYKTHWETGHVFLKNAAGKWGLSDPNGTIIQDFTWSAIGEDFNGKWISVANAEGKWGYVDGKGKTVVPFIYDAVTDLAEYQAEVMLDGKSKIIQLKGAK